MTVGRSITAASGEVLARLEELYALGAGSGAGGANRPGLSAAEEAAHERVETWMHDAGLETDRDAAGNLYGRLRGQRSDLPEIWSGSHLDSVPSGGRFDGALGVLAPLSALGRLDAPPERTIAIVAFRDEEGCRFGRGFFGSRAATGLLPSDALDQVDAEGTTVRRALALLGRELDPGAGWLVPRPAAFLELHVEQGPALALQDAALGVVESIAGCVEFEVRFTGEEGHAGTTPMDARRDAGVCGAAFQLELYAAARAIAGAVATVGRVTLEPGATNVVPRAARLVVDARAPDDDRLDQLSAAITGAADRAAADHRCEAQVLLTSRAAPIGCHPLLRRVIAGAVPDAPLLASGAGHDAQVLGAAGVPTGMLFVRSLAGGISHSPREETAAADVEAAVEALTEILPALCRALPDDRRPDCPALPTTNELHTEA